MFSFNFCKILNNTYISLTSVVVFTCYLIVSTPSALAGLNPNSAYEPQDHAGKVVAIHDGKEIALPLLKSDYDVNVQGNVATVSLTQTFLNSGPVPLNAKYLFPMNQKAAVFAMEMRVGDELVKAIIKRKDEAKKIFDVAKSEGKAAALLTQHRPNMFTQNIANLMPGKPITITLEYLQIIPKIDNAYELVIPMIVGPRYEGDVDAKFTSNGELDMIPDTIPADEVTQKTNETVTISGWDIDKLPTYPPVSGLNIPENIDPERVNFSMKLNAAMPISNVLSDTHALSVKGDENAKTIGFANGKEIDNRDLILRYELSKDSNIASGVLSHHDERGGFLSLSIEPPKVPAQDSITPRELVFVLDTSGSMRGEPMKASKRFMATALANLRPNDYFRILRFSNNTSQFSNDAVRATSTNLSLAHLFVSGLSTGGGTEMDYAIKTAFNTPQPQNTMRIIVFLSDGYIGGDRQVIQTVKRNIGDARIYAFGVGNSVNRFLLEGMAREGRGYARFVGINEASVEVAQSFAADLKSPLLTDISIDWNGLEVSEQTQTKIPDLFAGGSVNVLARYKKSGAHKIFVKGLVNGRKASIPLNINLAASNDNSNVEKNNALPLLWARETIFEKNREYTLNGEQSKSLKEQIVKLGLDYSLQSRFTSFVAVSKKIYNKTPENNKTGAVPLPKVSGLTAHAYPTSLNLSGSSAPEPETLLGMMVALMMVVVRFWKNVAAWLRNLGTTLKSRNVFKKEQDYVLNKQLPPSLRKDFWWIDS